MWAGTEAIAQNTAVEPVPRDREGWMDRHEAMNARIAQGNVDLIFVGDSITQGWEGAGKDTWDQYYAHRNAANLGISGDRTEHVLWRLDNGNIDGIAPKLAVVMIGTNNHQANTAEEIGAGVVAVVEKLRAELPETKVLLLAIFPREETPGQWRAKLAEANRIASEVADGEMVHYLDIAPFFLEPDGTLPEDVMPDFLHPNEAGYAIWARAIEPKVAELMGELELNEPPRDFTAIFNGVDFTGWQGLVADPEKRAAMTKEELAAAQAEADALMQAHWRVEDGVLAFDGEGSHLCTTRHYGDFEMIVDWKMTPGGDSGIYLRGSPQVQIWDPAQRPEGSGGLFNNEIGPSKPLVMADRPIGEWNRFRILMIGDTVTVYLNDVLIVDQVVLENYWDRDKPIYPEEQIELQSHGSPMWFKNVFVREIPREGEWQALFNGQDLSGWEQVGGENPVWHAENGLLYTDGAEGGGWLSTTAEYGDFHLDLEFLLPPGGNSGVFIRAPREGNPAFEGSEIQVLDDYADEYATLQPWQYSGSVYATAAPALRATKPAGEWQRMQIYCLGPQVQVALNGYLIVDADLSEHPDKLADHPGLARTTGYIGLQNHGSRLDYRNIRIRPLAK